MTEADGASREGMGQVQDAGSVARVRAALRAAGHDDQVQRFPEGTRSAAEAAAAVGCDIGQIAKSIIFRAGAQPVLAIASGAHRVDMAKLAEAIALPVKRADAQWVRDATGFAIGGVAPVGHLTAPVVVLDAALRAWPRLWAAAGSPMHVFATDAEALARLTGGRFADIAEAA